MERQSTAQHLECVPLQVLEGYDITQEDPRVFLSVDKDKPRRWPSIPYPKMPSAPQPNDPPHPDPEAENRKKQIDSLLDHIEAKVHKDLDFLKAHGRDGIASYKKQDQTRIFNKIESGDLKCPSCGDDHNFSSTQKLKNHFRSYHLKQTPYVCPTDGCTDHPEGFNSTSSLREHMIAKHQKDPGSKRKKIPSKPATRYICPTCGWGTFSHSEYKRHVAEHLEDFHCPECNKDHKRKKALTDHLENSCPVLRARGVYDYSEKHECDQCGKSFTHLRSLTRHKKIHLQ